MCDNCRTSVYLHRTLFIQTVPLITKQGVHTGGPIVNYGRGWMLAQSFVYECTFLPQSAEWADMQEA